MQVIKEVLLYNCDSLEYEGKITVNNGQWQFEEIDNEHLVKTTAGMPLKAVLATLIAFDIVYDIIEE
mgnify:CR=1 FL=1